MVLYLPTAKTYKSLGTSPGTPRTHKDHDNLYFYLFDHFRAINEISQPYLTCFESILFSSQLPGESKIRQIFLVLILLYSRGNYKNFGSLCASNWEIMSGETMTTYFHSSIHPFSLFVHHGQLCNQTIEHT